MTKKDPLKTVDLKKVEVLPKKFYTPDLLTQVLREALSLLWANGWVQGTMHTDLGYCSIGALNAATQKLAVTQPGYDVRIYDAYRDALQILFEQLPDKAKFSVARCASNREIYQECVIRWNDSLLNNGFDEVKRLFTQAIAAAEERGRHG